MTDPDIQNSLPPTDSDTRGTFAVPAENAAAGGVPVADTIAAKADQATANGDFEKLRILFVEDEEEDGQIIVSYLSELGVKEVVWVRSAVHALFQLREDKSLFPDVLITELVLSGTNGIQLIAKLRADGDPAIRRLPVITITSSDTSSIYRRATKYAISAYLKKPISLHGLRSGLLRVIEGKTIEAPLEFGRSWIDEAEDAEDSKSENAEQTDRRPGFLIWFSTTVLDFVWPSRRRTRNKHLDVSA